MSRSFLMAGGGLLHIHRKTPFITGKQRRFFFEGGERCKHLGRAKKIFKNVSRKKVSLPSVSFLEFCDFSF
jgi:hypothetical protein